jgi:hypothetical protein
MRFERGTRWQPGSPARAAFARDGVETRAPGFGAASCQRASESRDLAVFKPRALSLNLQPPICNQIERTLTS